MNGADQCNGMQYNADGAPLNPTLQTTQILTHVNLTLNLKHLNGWSDLIARLHNVETRRIGWRKKFIHKDIVRLIRRIDR